ncbi:MAG: OmpA family protein, partial [Paracoccaceae bacterium]
MKNFIVLLLTIVSFSFGIASVPNAVQAQAVYIPSIWVDPDGCEHWVMDDGAEGY